MQPSEPEQSDSERPAGPLPRHSSRIQASIGDNNQSSGSIQNSGCITATGEISPELLKILLEHAPELSVRGGKGNKNSSKISGSGRISIGVGRNVGGVPSTTPHNSTH